MKGCFGLFDSSCINLGNCPGLVTYAVKGSRYEFELWAANATSGSYIALALSHDDKMGDDSVTECAIVNGKVGAFMSYNDGKSNSRLRDVRLFYDVISFTLILVSVANEWVESAGNALLGRQPLLPC